jgi:hypothetical protein
MSDHNRQPLSVSELNDQKPLYGHQDFHPHNATNAPLARPVADFLASNEDMPYSVGQITEIVFPHLLQMPEGTRPHEETRSRNSLVTRVSNVMGQTTVLRHLEEQDMLLQRGMLKEAVPESNLRFGAYVFRAVGANPLLRGRTHCPYKVKWDSVQWRLKDEASLVFSAESDPHFNAGRMLITIDTMLKGASFEKWRPYELLSRILSEVPGRPYSPKELAAFVFRDKMQLARAVSDPRERRKALNVQLTRTGTTLKSPSLQKSLTERGMVLQTGKLLKINDQPETKSRLVWRALPVGAERLEGIRQAGPYEVYWQPQSASYQDPRSRANRQAHLDQLF